MLHDLDIVLVMTVNPGFGGQSFIPSTLDKLRRLYRIIEEKGYATQLEVDGGVKADDTARDSVAAGAKILVAGTAIFNREQSVAAAMAAMRESVDGVGGGEIDRATPCITLMIVSQENGAAPSRNGAG